VIKALDATIEFQLDLFRLDADTRRRVLPILDRLERELVALTPGTDLAKRRRDALLKEAREAIAKYYAEAQAELFATTVDLAPIAARAAGVAISVEAQLPPAGTLAKIAGDAVIQGATMAQWWSKQEGDTAFRYAAAVRQGLAAGETNAQIIQRVRGTAGFPGVVEISRKNAAALVQTSVQQVANDARMATFRANEDLIDAYVWITTLDGHVCEQCAARADLSWKADGTPVGHSIPFAEPPIHFNDRCVLVPDTGRGVGGERASTDGPTTGTFADFLERKGVAFQNDVLGPGRAELWRDGKITLQDLVNGRGNPLTLDELRERHG